MESTFTAGDIIRPAIVGRGIRSYVVVATDGGLVVRRWNVTVRAPYGDEIILDLNSKHGWTLENHSRGNACPDNRNGERTIWTHKDWNHHK